MIAVFAHGEPVPGEPLQLGLWLAGGALLGEVVSAASRNGDGAASRYALSAALSVSGLLHAVVTPAHFDEATYLGLFFAVSSLVLGWLAIRVLTSAASTLHRCAFAVSLSLILLYVAARELALPLVQVEGYSLLGNISKGAEALAATVAAAAAQPRSATPLVAVRSSRHPPWLGGEPRYGRLVAPDQRGMPEISLFE